MWCWRCKIDVLMLDEEEFAVLAQLFSEGIEVIGRAIEGVNSATFLTPEEKRDIFYNNAAEFFRLDKMQRREFHPTKAVI
jgi:hypothetical protein